MLWDLNGHQKTRSSYSKRSEENLVIEFVVLVESESESDLKASEMKVKPSENLDFTKGMKRNLEREIDIYARRCSSA